MSIWVLALTAVGSGVVSAAGVRVWRRIARAFKILDVPNDRSLHSRAVPRGGGIVIPIVILAGALGPAAARDALGPQGLAWLALSLIVVAGISFSDDLSRAPMWLKFVGHFSGAAIAIAVIGSPSSVTIPIIGTIPLGMLGLPLALFWIVGVTNAFNFLDGIDGIAGLQGAIVGLGLALVTWAGDTPMFAVFGAIVSGASLGFLAHNWPPARVFMGDVGSASLGFTFAVVTLMSGAVDARLRVASIMLLWPVLFDTGFTLLRRLLRGDPVLMAHRTHLYQRLVLSGHSHRTVSVIYGGLAFLGVACAVWTTASGATAFWISVLVIALAAVTLWLFVRSAERAAERSGMRPDVTSVSKAPRQPDAAAASPLVPVGPDELAARYPNEQFCPRCGARGATRQRSRNFYERKRKELTSKRLYRCTACQWRGWMTPLEFGAIAPIDSDPASPPLSSLDHGNAPAPQSLDTFTPGTLDAPAIPVERE